MIALGVMQPANSAESDFADVRSLLEARCLSCHNSQDRKGDLSLETMEELTASEQVVPGLSLIHI